MATKSSGGKKSTTTKKSTSTTKKAATAKKATSQKSPAKSTASTAQNIFGPFIRRIKSAGWMSIFESLIIGVLGYLFIRYSDQVTQVIFYIVGLFLIIKGVYRIINYFVVKGRYDFYNNDLLYGIIALIFGILIMTMWELLGGIIGIVVGAWMIYSALVRLNEAIKLHAAKIKSWFYVLLLALVMLALGLYLFMATAAGVINITGWIMIAAAVVGIINEILFLSAMNKITK